MGNFLVVCLHIILFRQHFPICARELSVLLKEGIFHVQAEIKLRQDPQLASRVNAKGHNSGSATEDVSATGACIWDSSVVCAKYLERLRALQQRDDDSLPGHIPTNTASHALKKYPRCVFGGAGGEGKHSRRWEKPWSCKQKVLQCIFHSCLLVRVLNLQVYPRIGCRMRSRWYCSLPSVATCTGF